MSNPASLVPFKAGDDPRRNSTGLNRGHKWLSTMLVEALKKVANDEGDTYDVLLTKRVLSKAIKEGDMRAVEHIYDRTEGKVEQRHTVAGSITHELSPEAQVLAQQLIDAQRTPITGSI